MYNVKLRRVHVTIVTMENYYIFCVCVGGLISPACKAPGLIFENKIY
jgi:hypothetical protein